MKPGDLAIVKCKRIPGLTEKIVLLLEWQKPSATHRSSRWLGIVENGFRSIPSGWLKEIK